MVHVDDIFITWLQAKTSFQPSCTFSTINTSTSNSPWRSKQTVFYPCIGYSSTRWSVRIRCAYETHTQGSISSRQLTPSSSRKTISYQLPCPSRDFKSNPIVSRKDFRYVRSLAVECAFLSPCMFYLQGNSDMSAGCTAG